MNKETSTDKQSVEEWKREFKELNLSLDDLSRYPKDAGHTWIAFTDKFNSFRERILAQLSSTQPLPQTEGKVYRWVKASERQPEHEKAVFVRYAGVKDVSSYQDGAWCGIDFHDYTEIEWLEEAEPLAQSVEADKTAEVIADKHLAYILTATQFKQIHYPAILAAMEEYAQSVAPTQKDYSFSDIADAIAFGVDLEAGNVLRQHEKYPTAADQFLASQTNIK